MSLHQSVLLTESVDGLSIKADGIYIDGTFGRGGHSLAILKRLNSDGRLIAIDKDLAAIAYAQTHLASDPRFSMVHGSFADLKNVAMAHQVYGAVNGVLLDLGVSSPQLDEAARGFSFMQHGPLDMRMNTAQAFTAAEFINQASVADMTWIFKEYGEERYAKRIAQAIASARVATAIETTTQLAEIVKQAHPRWEKHKHPATRVFQAIRIHVNAELDDLTQGLQQSLEVLAAQGRLVVLSFHSLEDRLVKHFMRLQEQGVPLPKELPIKASALQTNFRRINGAIKASEAEVKQNIRSRSAVLRIGEKIA